MTAGCFTIVKQQRLVLLVKRRDLRMWDLPGGHLEKNEMPEQAAKRELQEETGLQADTVSLCGIYERPDVDDVQYIFSTEVVAGNMIHEGSETVDIRYYDIEHLPLLMIPHRRKQIRACFDTPHIIHQSLKDFKWLYRFF